MNIGKKTIIDDKSKLVEKATRKKNAKRDRKYLSGRPAKDIRQKRRKATAKEIN